MLFQTFKGILASSNRCIASINKCLTSSNKKLLVTRTVHCLTRPSTLPTSTIENHLFGARFYRISVCLTILFPHLVDFDRRGSLSTGGGLSEYIQVPVKRKYISILKAILMTKSAPRWHKAHFLCDPRSLPAHSGPRPRLSAQWPIQPEMGITGVLFSMKSFFQPTWPAVEWSGNAQEYIDYLYVSGWIRIL